MIADLYPKGAPVKLCKPLLAFGNVAPVGWPAIYLGPTSARMHQIRVKNQAETQFQVLRILPGDIEPRFPLLQKEFPDFDLATLPAIPWKWDEASWHNDACPSFTIGDTSGNGEGIQVFIDYHDPERSEFPNWRKEGTMKRFNAQSTSGDGVDMDIASSDEWRDILAAVLAWRFGLNVRESFSEAEFMDMQQRNRALLPYPGGVCASHDFCDANMLMSDAFEAVIGRLPLMAPDGTVAHEDDCRLWSAAWNIATPRYLTAIDKESK